MIISFQQWALIAFLKGKPQDLSGNREGLWLAVAAAIASYILVSAVSAGLPFGVLHAIYDVGMAGIALYFALNLIGKIERFDQAFAAYCGSSTILNLASLFMLPSTGAETASPMMNAVHFFYLIWGLSVLGHIIRHTFELSLPASIASATGYFLFYMFLFSSLFGF